MPALLHDELVVIESSVILQYFDELSDKNILIPSNRAARVHTQLWLLRCLNIRAAINTITFSTINREKILKSRTQAQIEVSIARMPDPKMANKRRDLMQECLSLEYVTGDFSP